MFIFVFHSASVFKYALLLISISAIHFGIDASRQKWKNKDFCLSSERSMCQQEQPNQMPATNNHFYCSIPTLFQFFLQIVFLIAADENKGFLFFDGADEFLNSFDDGVQSERWIGAPLENFHWDPSKPKLMVCHDFNGGYKPYESLNGTLLPLPDGPEARICDWGKTAWNQSTPCHPDSGCIPDLEHMGEETPTSSSLFNQMSSHIGSLYNSFLGGNEDQQSTENQNTASDTNFEIVQPFVFFYWWYIDVFAYFSHRFITVPPKVWIDQAHRHGVLVLGTFITEFDEGYSECEQLFKSKSKIDQTVIQLTDLTIRYNFDGWLINIENNITTPNIENVVYFLDNLRSNLSASLKHSQVVWYDSLLANGSQGYENEMNYRNAMWFDHVTGFFVNYGWKPGNLTNTVQYMATNVTGRQFSDVYIGIDVWGRNVTGGWNTSKAMDRIRPHNFSISLFAPGWLTEVFTNRSCLFEHSSRFWHSLRPQQFVGDAGVNFHRPILSRNFSTDFKTGISLISPTTTKYRISDAQLQPHYLTISSTTTNDEKTGLELIPDSYEMDAIDRKKSENIFVLFLCNISINEDKENLPSTYTAATNTPKIAIWLNSTKNATIRVSFRTSNDRLPQHVSVYGSEFNVAKQRPGEELLETAEIRYDVPVPQGAEAVSEIALISTSDVVDKRKEEVMIEGSADKSKDPIRLFFFKFILTD